MPASRIIEAVDVFKDGDLSVATCAPGALPQQLSLDRLEEGFDSRVVVAIASPAHRCLEPMLAQDFLIVVRAILTAAICVVDAAFWRSAQSYPARQTVTAEIRNRDCGPYWSKIQRQNGPLSR